ncbi:MAG TPA: NAD(P)H-quinone oxidoreductase [Candidatus Obscuribacterales bacterium]
MVSVSKQTMQAIVISRPGGSDVLELQEVPMPHPGKGEVRVRVRATAVNRVDLLQRMGVYPAPPDAPQDIPGIEYAGEIDAVGEAVTTFAPGDRVFGLCGGGAYAEYLVVHSRTVLRMPRELQFTEAAAIPEAFMTAYDALFTQARLGPGETLLVHAAGSGVGTAAIQLAVAHGVRVIGTARTARKLEAAGAFGMHEGILLTHANFAREVLKLTAEMGVDVVLELVGGWYLPEDIECAAPGARIIVVGLVAGSRADVELSAVLKKRLEIRGTVLRARPLEEKILLTRSFSRHVLPFIRSGNFKAVIDRVLPLPQAAEAQEYLAGNQNFGKVVLSIA